MLLQVSASFVARSLESFVARSLKSFVAWSLKSLIAYSLKSLVNKDMQVPNLDPPPHPQKKGLEISTKDIV